MKKTKLVIISIISYIILLIIKKLMLYYFLLILLYNQNFIFILEQCLLIDRTNSIFKMDSINSFIIILVIE